MGRLLLAASLRDHPEWRQGCLYGDVGTLVLDGDEPVAGIMSLGESVWFGGETVVSSQPVAAAVRLGAPIQAMHACRTALADHWRACGTPLIVKWGIVRDALNELLGFSPVMLGWEVCLRFGTDDRRRPDAVRPATPHDLAALSALYDERARHHVGAGVRTPQQWHEAFWPHFTEGASRQLLVYDGPDGVDGYLALRPGSPTGGPGVMVTEWVDRTPAAFQHLWAMLRHLAGDQLTVTLPPMPPDRPLMALLPAQADMRPIRSLLLRPGLPERFWPFVRCRPGHGEMTLAVRDATGLWPERLDLHWADGRVTMSAARGPASVRTDVGTMGLLALGAMTIGDAVRLRLIDGSDADLQKLDGLFVHQPIYRYPADNRVNKQFRQW
jgi:hypothetical protein